MEVKPKKALEKTISSTIILKPFDNKRLLNLYGNLDENLKQIEQRLKIKITATSNSFNITGNRSSVNLATIILQNLYAETDNGKLLSPKEIHLAIHQAKDNASPSQAYKIKTPLTNINARTKNQQVYLNNILKHDINFGIGPAGTGKTFLAVASAVSNLEQYNIRRIILVRPVVEAGERLGFLPGDLTQKIDPYLRPLYDSLYEMLGFEKVTKLLEQNIIEIAPLAYMRGRTLSDAFIILDESQNTTIEQMKMFLTRVGFSSKVVITGDITQVDLPKGKLSGLKHACQVLNGVENIGFTYFDSKDVIRHPLVQKIIDAYDKNGEI